MGGVQIGTDMSGGMDQTQTEVAFVGRGRMVAGRGAVAAATYMRNERQCYARGGGINILISRTEIN